MPPATRNLRLDEAVGLAGCPVCRVVVQRVAQTLESIQDELVLDPDYRERVDAAWGFCNEHARQWLNEAQPLSTAIIYEAVLGRVSHALDQVSSGRSGVGSQLRSKLRAGKVGGMLVETRVCPLCLARDEHERQLVAQLLEELRSERFRDRYASSEGLCVTHLDLALCARPDAAALSALRDCMARTNDALRSQLREVIRQHDYRFRDEIAGAEWKAIARSIDQVVGIPGIDGRRVRSTGGE